MFTSKFEYFQSYLRDNWAQLLTPAQRDQIATQAAETFLDHRDQDKMDGLTDAELLALTAVVTAERVKNDGHNSNYVTHGHEAPITNETPWPALDALTEELKRRKVLP